MSGSSAAATYPPNRSRSSSSTRTSAHRPRRCSRTKRPETPTTSPTSWRYTTSADLTDVAGSSPVAPVKVPANRHVALSVRMSVQGRLHRLFRRASPKRSKTARNPSGDDNFKPTPNGVQADRESGVRLHKIAGGQAPRTQEEPFRPPSDAAQRARVYLDRKSRTNPISS